MSVTVTVLILLFAVGAGILAGIFSVNETKDVVTASSAIHGTGAAIGFMALLFVPLCLAIAEYRCGHRMIGSIFILSFVLSFISFTLFIMSDKPDFKHTIIAQEGLWERLSLAAMYIPFVVDSIRSIANNSIDKNVIGR